MTKNKTSYDNLNFEQLKTENQQLKEEINSLKELLSNAELVILRLEHLNKYKDSASEIAHEINNPINIVKGSVNIIKRNIQCFIELMSLYQKLEGFENQPGYKEIKEMEEDVDVPLTQEELVSALATINKGFERIQEIAYNLSLLGKEQQAQQIKIDINESIEEILFMIQNKINGQIEIRKELGEIPPITSNQGKLNQVFINLIKNAIEAIQEKHELNMEFLSIQTSLKGEHILIKIKDTGVGMTEETKEKLFEKFYTTKSPGKGTGLGMGVVKEIIESHHGNISIESERGKGTEFTISLPVIVKS